MPISAIVEITTLPPAERSRTRAIKVPSALEFPTQDVVVLRSERNDDRTESALLFVPDDARDFLQGRITDYGRDLGNRRGRRIGPFGRVGSLRRRLSLDPVDLRLQSLNLALERLDLRLQLVDLIRCRRVLLRARRLRVGRSCGEERDEAHRA